MHHTTRILGIGLSLMLAAASAGAQIVSDPDWLHPLVNPPGYAQDQVRASACFDSCNTAGVIGANAGGVFSASNTYVGPSGATTSNTAKARVLRDVGSVGVAASGGFESAGNASGIVQMTEVFGVQNLGSATAAKTLDFYVHATVAHDADATYGQASLAWSVRVFQLVGSVFQPLPYWSGSQTWRFQTYEGGADEVRQHWSLDVYVPPVATSGASIFAVQFWMAGSTFGDADLNAMNTANMYIPPQSGFVVGTRNGFLTHQAIPDWAAPQTTTPEPATLALLAVPLGLIGAGAARRRRLRMAA